MPLFMSGIVLMLSMWGSGSPITLDTMKELEDTHKAMTMLKEMAPRFHFAGRFWDMLYGLAIVGELPLPSHLMPQDSQQQDRATSTASAEESSSPADEVSANATFIPLPPKLQDSTTMTSTATMQPSLETNRTNEMGWLPHRVLYDADSSAPDTTCHYRCLVLYRLCQPPHLGRQHLPILLQILYSRGCALIDQIHSLI